MDTDLIVNDSSTIDKSPNVHGWATDDEDINVLSDATLNPLHSTGSDRESLASFLTESENATSGIWQVTFNMSNAIVGAGIIGLPYAFKLSGLWFGLCLMVLMAILTNYSLGILIQSGVALRERSYEATAMRSLGPWGERAVLACQLAFDYGAGLSYLIITGDTVTAVLREILPGGYFRGLRQVSIVVPAFLFMLPLCAQRDISKLENASSASIATVFVVFTIVFVKLLVNGPGDGTVHFLNTRNPLGVVTSIGIFLFAFVCQDCIFLYYNTLHNATTERFAKVRTMSFAGSTVLEALFGLCGYLSFKDHTEDNLLSNYAGMDSAAMVMRALYAFTMVLTFPIAIFVCRQALHALLYPADVRTDCREISLVRHATYTAVLFGSSVLITMKVDNLGTVMGVTGSVAGAMLGFVLPGLIALSTSVRHRVAVDASKPNVTKQFPIGPAALVVFGMASVVLGAVTSFVE